MPFQIVSSRDYLGKTDAAVCAVYSKDKYSFGGNESTYSEAIRLLRKEEKSMAADPGKAGWINGFGSAADYLIYTSFQVNADEKKELEILQSCYRETLRTAEMLNCSSVSVPLIFLKNGTMSGSEAMQTAVSEIRRWLWTHEMEIILIVDQNLTGLSGNIVPQVDSYINEKTGEYDRRQTEKMSIAEKLKRFLKSRCSRRAFTGSYSSKKYNDSIPVISEDNEENEDGLKFDQTSETLRTADKSDSFDDSEEAVDIFSYVLSDEENTVDDFRPATGIVRDADEFLFEDFSEPEDVAEKTQAAEKSVDIKNTQKTGIPCKEIKRSESSEKTGNFHYNNEEKRNASMFREDRPVYAAKKSEKDRRNPGKSGAAFATGNSRKLDDVLGQIQESFSDRVLRLIDERRKTDVEVYKRANLDRKLFSKIRGSRDYQPSKKTALALAIGLELNIDETKDLLQRGGYALSPSSITDLIVEFFIMNGIYDIYQINLSLFEHHQATL